MTNGPCGLAGIGGRLSPSVSVRTRPLPGTAAHTVTVPGPRPITSAEAGLLTVVALALGPLSVARSHAGAWLAVITVSVIGPYTQALWAGSRGRKSSSTPAS